MIAPLFRVPSRNSMLIDDTDQGRAAAAHRAQHARRINTAALTLAILFAIIIAAYLLAAVWDGRL